MDTQPCDCGSGLRRQRCCGADLGDPPRLSATRHLASVSDCAARAFGRGELDIATELALDMLELMPTHPEALSTLFRIRFAQNNGTAAEALLRRYVGLYPNDSGHTCDLALLLMQRGKPGDAEIHARNAVRLSPINPVAHNLMGMIATEAGRPRLGEFHYRRVLALTGARDPIVLANLAWNLKTQGRIADARALYEESDAAAPAVLQTLLGWARLEEADRQFARAGELLDRAEALVAGHDGVRLARAVLHGRMQDYQAALDVLDGMSDTSDSEGPNELLEKGRLLDRIGRYDEAFAAFDAGKRAARAAIGHSYLDAAADNLISRSCAFFQASRLHFTPRATVRSDVPQPVFILGFPRSGTTLVEQIVSAHPSICAGDELPFINEITHIMPRMLNSPLSYPEALSELWMGDQHEGLDNLRDYYLQRVRQLGVLRPGASWFTDKMPLNETHLGLIALLFPAAPLVHVLRHPLDVVLSMYSNHLSHGFHCASELATAARHYVRVMDLVDHYRAEMALHSLVIRYEDIVTGQEASVRRLLDFIGVPFEPKCLDFADNRRHARTASYAQVTEPLYDRSLYRYRNYSAQLEPVIEVLRPVIARLGYTIDTQP